MNFKTYIIFSLLLAFLQGCSSGDDAQIQSIVDCDNCPEMVFIPAGEFMMGARPYDKNAFDWEQKLHRVVIEDGFYMGKYEVTFQQYMACVNDGGCSYSPPSSYDICKKNPFCSAFNRTEEVNVNRLPVTGINLKDAMEYVAWLSQKTGKEYLIPTEEQWEYAARGNTETIYWWGDEIGEGNALCSGCSSKVDEDMPEHVGNYAPNHFGLYDVIGNAAELVMGCYNADLNLKPNPRIVSDCDLTAERGGSWWDSWEWASLSARTIIKKTKRSEWNGFRVIRR
ncbi:MAG: SUMF1/EgtB/PvdO family nonheme iron enzyme [Emcibacteraceae bacterium]